MNTELSSGEEQQGFFPDDEKIKKLNARVSRSHKTAKTQLEKLGEYGEFYRLVSKYAGALDGKQTDTADELLLSNLEFAEAECDQLKAKIGEIRSLLNDARLAAIEIGEIKRNSKI